MSGTTGSMIDFRLGSIARQTSPISSRLCVFLNGLEFHVRKSFKSFSHGLLSEEG
jgi:hypothetical protein